MGKAFSVLNIDSSKTQLANIH